MSFLHPLHTHLPSRIIVDRRSHHSRSILLAGTVRSGTTWASAIINYNNEYRYLFEPFYPALECCDHFKPRPYLPPENQDPQLLQQAEAIFCGRIRDRRVDQFNTRIVSSKRLIKVIHANLMLKWIRIHFPAMPIVLLLRHPCAIAHSLLRLGWAAVPQHFLQQQELMSNALRPFRKHLERAESAFEHHIFMWCIETYVPLKQLAPGDVHLIFYERLCEQPEAEIAGLFAFLGKVYDPRVLARSKQPSPLSRPDSAIISGDSLIDGWKGGITEEQLERAMEILHLFGLDGIYGEQPMPNVENAYDMMAELA